MVIVPGGGTYSFILWALFFVPKIVLWLWVIVRAGRYGARQGDRRLEETTVVDQPIRAIDPSKARRSNDG